MPKKWQRGKMNNTESWRGHDDRGNNKQKRRVGFKTPHPNNHLAQNRGTVQMAIDSYYDNFSLGEPSNQRGRRSPHSLPHNPRRIPNQRRLGNPTVVPPWRVNKSGNINKNLTWYKVIIPQGNKYPKDFILKSIADLMSPKVFCPLMYTAYDKEAVFYVDSESDANDVVECNNRIVAADGFRFRVIVRPGYPNLDPTDINDELKNKIKLALNKRFIEANNAIDLKSFHRDEAFGSEHFCALFRPVIMSTVLTIIAEHIPNVMALNLNDNKLVDIRSLKMLVDKFPNLKILYLGDNKIKEIHQLDIIQELKIQELNLQGNPLCNRFKSRPTEYVSEVQKRFPGLVRLDGQEVKKAIVFDLEEDTKNMLPSRMIFFMNEESKNIAMNFLMEYFRVYDSGNRQNLMNAYHEQASMSLTVSFQSQPQKLSKYLQENRNLFRVSDSHRRHKLLKTGRLQVVSLIDSLPKTQHIEQSFTMDVCLATKEMIMVVVTGVFKELNGKEDPLRYFNRTIIIVPEGAGFCICNEQLHIAQATEEEEKKYREILKMSLNVAPSSSIAPVPVVAPVVAPSNEDMQRMALALSQQTNMNLDWSVKCLEQCGWNFDNALAAFQSCFKSGQIPPEAFNK